MRKRDQLSECQRVIKEYEDAFEAYHALTSSARCDGARVVLHITNRKLIEKAQQRLAIAERELLELDAA